MTGPSSTPQVRQRRLHLDRVELGLLLAFGVLSLWVVAVDLFQVVVHHRVWTGTDGGYIVDQLQYLSWIRSTADHGLVANLFVLRQTPADYFQPGIAISALFSAIGVPGPVALLIWKPVAVVSLFVAVRAFAHRLLAGTWQRRSALTLALFFGFCTIAYGSFTVLGDLYPVFLSWGYTFGVIGLGAMTGAIVIYAADRGRGRIGPWPAVLGALATILHPWHGELLALVLVLSEAWAWRRGDRSGLRMLLVALAGIGLVLVYYWLLSRTDLSWKLARGASKHVFSIWPIVIYIAPLALPALLGYRRRAGNFLEIALRAWPVATLVEWALSSSVVGATPLHAFQGLTIPLSVLAVQGVAGLGVRWGPPRRARWLLIGILALATIPGAVLQMRSARDLAAPTVDNANFITHGESAALDYLDRVPRPGGVITRSYLGALVPSRTGRHVLVGDCLWSEPGCLTRTALALQLFAGSTAPAAAQDLVRRSGARFLLSDCRVNADLRRVLAPLLASVRRFGCATVYEVRPSGPPSGPLADSRATYAVVRPARGH
jgi:hypothetical protein